MKSRTSSFNLTALKKDIVRFAPAWGLYTVGALLVVASMRLSSSAYSFAQDMAGVLRFGMPIINLIYALLVAQLLFGDLYNARMCNALHALPIRREGWFATHVTAGIAFSLIPNLALACLCACLLGVEFAPIAFWWLLGSTLQYLFFFGLAVFCALCVGSRFAMAVLYGITNFLSMLAYWFVNTLYTPLLYGLDTPMEGFLRLCPVAELMRRDYVKVSRYYPLGRTDAVYKYEVVGQNWVYPAVLAGIGVLLLVAAVLLYRKRKLESAGDFVAFKPVAPVFCLLYTLTVGAFFQMFFRLFVGDSELLDYVFLTAGIIVGFFTGQMLLERNVRVFHWKKWAACAGLIALVLGSLLVTGLDPMGVSSWVPEAEKVASVSVSDSYYVGTDDGSYTTSDPEQIRKIVEIQDQHLQDYRNTDQTIANSRSIVTLRLTYTLTDGTVKSRFYLVEETTESFELLRGFYGQPELVLGYTDWEAFLADVQDVYFYDNWGGDSTLNDPTRINGLLEALRQDCLETDLAQNWAFRDQSATMWINISITNGSGGYVNREIRVFENCENTLTWLKENLGFVPATDKDGDWRP